MKLASILLVGGAASALAAQQAQQAQQELDPVKICGRLGVMKIDPADLPEGASMEDVRMCADHPLGWRNYFGYGDYLPDWFP